MATKKTLKQFLEEVEKIHGSLYNYSKVEYLSTDKKIIVICKTHGEFTQTPARHLLGRGCHTCGKLSSKQNSQRLSLEEVLERISKIHGNKYTYENLNVTSGTSTKLKINCLTHGQFIQPLKHHLRGNGCKKCGVENSAKLRMTSLQDFITRANKKHDNLYDYSLITELTNPSGKSKVKIICKIHGVFTQARINHLGGNGCPSCKPDKIAKKRALTLDEFIKRSNEAHDYKYDYSKVIYKNQNSIIKVLCPIHGLFTQNAGSHMLGCACKKCSNEENADNQSDTLEEFIKKAKLAHGDRYDYSKVVYKRSSIKVEVICSKHGSFWIRPNCHITGRAGCRTCSKAGTSRAEVDWLDDLGIPNDKNHRQVRIKAGNRVFTADGYDPLTNTVYEFHGDYWHGNLNIYEPDYLNKVTGKSMQYLYDKTCKKHRDVRGAGYNLAWIWESDWDKRCKEIKQREIDGGTLAGGGEGQQR